MKYAIKILSLVMAAVVTVSMAACSRNIYAEVAATADYATELNSGSIVTATNSNGDTVIVTNNSGEFITQNNDKTNVNNSEDNTTSNQGGTQGGNQQSTTKPTTTKPTTTKPPVLVVPDGESAIIEAYNKAANKTKAQNNMTVDKTNDVEIVIDEFAGSTGLAKLATGIASGFMEEYNGQVVTEKFVSGKPTKDTTTKDKKTGKLANSKELFIPIMNKSYMSQLTTNDIISAEVTEKTNDKYKVVIKLKSESTPLSKPPAIITRGMDYFDQEVFDLGGFSFVGGTVNYKNCIITATVNAYGFVEKVEHKMSVSSTDAQVKFGFTFGAKLHGDYVTTLKFYDIK